MADNLLQLNKADSQSIREFADHVERLEADGCDIRTTVMIVTYDDNMTATVHTRERLGAVIGVVEISKDMIKEYFNETFS